MKINLKIRFKHWGFIVGLLGVITSPILAYYGKSYADFTTWESVIDVIKSVVANPYLLGSIAMAILGFLGVLTDPTTHGISDSERALQYNEPKKGGLL